MVSSAWLIPVFPLLSFVLLLLFRPVKERAAGIGIVLSGLSFFLAAGVLFAQFQTGNTLTEATWLTIGSTDITMGLEINPLNALMLVIVTLVSFLVHIYSRGYMAEDDRMTMFFAYLGLFTFSMAGLVISPNLLQLYIFWELVGACSFLLIGFYYYKAEAKAAAKKAFIVTRVGDVGLFIGMLLLFWQVGSFEFDAIFSAVEEGAVEGTTLTLIAILVFIGAMGKSGQFPLHTWLPDAMEGPTPVSALIHAATMVAAGVYLVAAMFPLFEASPAAMTTIAVVGGITAIFAATIGLVQNDIKRVLAYSTVSQLGYMMLALGSAGYVAGVFHLMTHAFFKALLFLAAGSVIHAVHTQNIKEMGGLWKRLNVTGTLFLIGSLAISGVPLFSGFFSKDEILLAAYSDGRYVLFALGIITAFLTAFYVFRLFFLVFMGDQKRPATVTKINESPKVMLFPMVVLGVLAVVSGYVNTTWFGTFLGDWLATGPYDVVHEHGEGAWWIPWLASLLAIGGIALAWLMYAEKKISHDWLSKTMPGVHQLLFKKYYIDEAYDNSLVRGTTVFSYFWHYFDKFIVEGIVAFAVGAVRRVGKAGANVQSGQVQTYGAVAFAGLVAVMVILALTGGYFG
ncbi:NADH-quinone oxidoreductase subunit L [Pseudalkalibacillus caeni]|uniref:NADH-quinone oxidoreductase subunit L n=1 Tax=Exobacillus caeni TaxID=2574798 RepID=A0A5R9F084_9BACL|nr:NADH-quinone oxidoreductase subunit L [Pseudalkalibacillus caeni]TLS35820.1 NADH-quinone oxidoreductase subunit L [Pseudalkalibacillus caeni]